MSGWVRDIALTPEQEAALLAGNPAYNRQGKGRAIAAANRRAERIAAQGHGRELARLGEPLHVAGCMLYWAEGSKHRNTLGFSNSDPEMVRLFVRFLRTYFDVPDEAIRLTCNLFADHFDRQHAIERYWLSVARLPVASLRKSTVNTYSKYSQRKRKGMLPFGTCRISLSRTAVAQSIYGAIQE